jgi:AraC-like DNA-binding protein
MAAGVQQAFWSQVASGDLSSRDFARIAIDHSFHDHAHFARAFRRIMGQTPSDYRAAHQSPMSVAGSSRSRHR